MYPMRGPQRATLRADAEGRLYFDAIVRQEPIDEEELDPADNAVDFTVISDATSADITAEIERVAPSGRAIIGDFAGRASATSRSCPARRTVIQRASATSRSGT